MHMITIDFPPSKFIYEHWLLNWVMGNEWDFALPVRNAMLPKKWSALFIMTRYAQASSKTETYISRFWIFCSFIYVKLIYVIGKCEHGEVQRNVTGKECTERKNAKVK